VGELTARGEAALDKILPFECIQGNENKKRDYDSALLFLIYPTEAATGSIADRIIANVREHLEGRIGIARYRHDTFWCPNYKEILGDSDRTDGLYEQSARMQIRVAGGEEAQWCLFDSTLSTIYARRFADTANETYLDLQIHYLNRALGQLTPVDSRFGPLKCPEAYYLDHGQWIPNDATPLLWAHANLRLALWHMEQNASQV
jgi:phosphorylase kinase alpha/beta subunit